MPRDEPMNSTRTKPAPPGRKGGQEVSRNRAHMSEIGRRGGTASRGGRGRSVIESGGSGQQGTIPTSDLAQRAQASLQPDRNSDANANWAPNSSAGA